MTKLYITVTLGIKSHQRRDGKLRINDYNLDEFLSYEFHRNEIETTEFECGDCPNVCEIVEIRKNEQLIARFGSRCKKWDDLALIHDPHVDQKITLEPLVDVKN